MAIGFDRKLLAADGKDPQFAVILLDGKNVENAGFHGLADRWRPHMTSTLFAMPRFNEASGMAGDGAEAGSLQASAELVSVAAELDK